jgi:exonuclease III
MNNRTWQILCWNIRGLNGCDKWDAVRMKIDESACTVLCLQETKRPHFDMLFIRKFAPKRFDSFDYIPSDGASGGILLLWNSSVFSGTVIDKQSFAITANFRSVHNSNTWTLSTVYGPCQKPERSEFIQWFRAQQISDEDDWLFVGHFNFYRSLEDRNRPGGNLQDTFVFNDAIGQLGLVEIPLKGRAYTWSNMQSNPLLEQLDWFFSSVNWTHSYPATEVLPLAKITSDHIPCKISIGTSIPRSNIFRFQNFWCEHEGFAEIVQN